MAKRELLLILIFAIAGVVVYQLTAPASKSGGFSVALGETARRALREMRSENFTAELKTEAEHEAPATAQEIRIRNVREIVVIGEAREDVATELVVTSSGVDKAEAERLAAAATLRVDTTPEAIAFTVDYPQDGTQQARLQVRVPARLRARIEGIRGETRATDVAGVFLASTRGDTTLTNIQGTIEGDHRGGRLTVTGASGIRLTLRSVDLRIQTAAGPVTLDLNGGEAKAGTLTGALQLESRSADVDVESVAGPVRVNAVGGSVKLGQLRQTVRCDTQHTDLRLTLAQAAEITAFTTGGELDVTVPPGVGAIIDAAATDGDLRVSGTPLTVRTEGRTKRVSAPIGGGGPTVSLRSTGGTIIVRAGTQS